MEQEFLLSKLKICFQEHNSDNEDNKSEHSNEEESNNILSPNDVKIISLINKVVPPKWYAKVHIVVAQDYAFDIIVLIDSGANLNCIQEGLIPSKYFEKSTQRLNSASVTKLIMLMLGPNFSFTKLPILTIPGLLLLTKTILEGFFPSNFLGGRCILDLSLIFFSLNLLKVSLFLRTILRLMLMVQNFPPFSILPKNTGFLRF